MKATPLTPAEIFGNEIRYVVPLFQRPYVWDEDSQWGPLWDDVVRVADSVLETPAPTYGPPPVAPHFLGAVVVDQPHTGVNYISVRGVVDGQQRMTTLQLLMSAARNVAVAHGEPTDAEALSVLVLNRTQTAAGGDARFKVWPTDRDQSAFRAVMSDPETGAPGTTTRISRAHASFTAKISEWAEPTDDAERCRRRLTALTRTLHHFLKVVVIDLEPGDNAQVIFETLNHRGTPLLAADLIKNLIFQTAEAQGLDVEKLYRATWAELDTDFWRQEVTQGRLYRPRIDVFMQYWLTMRLLREVATDRIFVEFRDHLVAPGAPALTEVVRDLVADAAVFASLDKHPAHSVVGRFQYRVLKALDNGVVTPLALWLLRIPDTECSEEQRNLALLSMESWLVRRAVCQSGTKAINILVVDLLKHLDANPRDQVGTLVAEFLAKQTAPNRSWPKDEEVAQVLATRPLYRTLTRPRLRMLLEALEDDLRAAAGGKTEDERCPRNLTVEHVMPQAWQTHWPLESDVDDPTLAGLNRDELVHTLGNLTLVTQALNPSMSNGPWTDEQAIAVGLSAGKQSALSLSVLRLNSELTSESRFDEATIRRRGAALAARVSTIWPRPASAEGDDAHPVDTGRVSTDVGPTTTESSPSDGAADEVLNSGGDRTATDLSDPLGKYAPLYRWLRDQPLAVDNLPTTFADVEAVLGFSLPESSRAHSAHWYSYDASAVVRAIRDAGWRASSVNLAGERLTFVRLVETDGQAQVADEVVASAGRALPSGHGRTDADWGALVDSAHEILVDVARRRDLTNYTELNRELAIRTGLRPFDFNDPSERNAMGKLLAAVTDVDVSSTHTMLSAVVVYLRGNDAGPGFYTYATELGLLAPSADNDRRLSFWTRQVALVHRAYAT